jgi:formylmethanofuran dehydrogenase subunit E
MLPTPHYAATESDPQWLRYAAQFHGHLGPWATAGVRLGAAGRLAIAAQGHFDVKVTCGGPFDRPPRSCFLDGLQVATGATLGKRNLHWKREEAITVRVENTPRGKIATVRPTPGLLELLVSIRSPVAPDQHREDATADHRNRQTAESIARRIATMPTAKLCELQVEAAARP